MANFIVPVNYSLDSIVKIDDHYYRDRQVELTLGSIVDSMKAINPAFNVIMFLVSGSWLSVIRPFTVNMENTLRVCDQNVSGYSSQYYPSMVGIDKNSGISRSGTLDNCYILYNGVFGTNRQLDPSHHWEITLSEATYSGTTYYYHNHQYYQSFIWVEADSLIVNGSPYIPYNWQAWDYLRGNNGQFKMDLTMLLSDYFPNDFSTTEWYESNKFSRITNDSSIWNAYLNAYTGVESDIAWNGNCRMTMTINNTAYPEIKAFVFKFYDPDMLTPFFSCTYELPVASSLQTSNYRNLYLSFIYDDGHQLAVFYPIGNVPLSSPYYCHPSNTAMTESQMATLYRWLQARDAGSGNPDDPYDSGSEDNGGDPSGYMGPQDDLLDITPPTLDASSSGLYRIYCPTDAQLVNIASFLWSDSFITNVKKYFGNVSDNIMAFYVLPYKPNNLPTKTFRVGTVDSSVTEVEYVYDRFVTIDMGEVNVGSKWGSYLDFEPYTKFNVYLPGIGVQALDGDEIMCPTNKNRTLPDKLGSTLKLEYNMDLMTGILVAFIKINGQVRYQFTGKIGYQIPLSGETHRSLLQGYAMATAGLVGMIASGGSAAPFTAAAATAGIVNAMKPDFYRGGNLSGDAASMCYKTPYLITRRPNKPMLVDQPKFTGYQSYKTGLLSEFSGYTECVDAHVEGISCTEEEREMIIDWLRKGVIL